MSETGYELGSVMGTALIGGLVSGFYQRFLVVPQGVGEDSARSARETLGGAYDVAAGLPQGAELAAAAGEAYGQAIAVTSGITAAAVVLFAGLIFWLLRTPTTMLEVNPRTGQLSMVPAPGQPRD